MSPDKQARRKGTSLVGEEGGPSDHYNLSSESNVTLSRTLLQWEIWGHGATPGNASPGTRGTPVERRPRDVAETPL